MRNGVSPTRIASNPASLTPLTRRVAQRVASLLECGVTVSIGDRVVAEAGSLNPDAPSIDIPVTYQGQSLGIRLQGPRDASAERWAPTVIELVIEQATVIEHLPHLDQLRDRFIRDLLLGELQDETDVRRLGQILGVDLEKPRSVILIDDSRRLEADREGPDTPVRQIERSRDIISSVVRFFRLPNETICGYIGDGEVAVLKASTSQDLERWSENASEGAPSSWADLGALKRAVVDLSHHLERDIGTPLDIGVGRYHPGLTGLRASYEDCRLALELGRTRQPRSVHCLDELGLAAFVAVAHEMTKRSLAGRILQPLRHDPDLIPTLRAFFESECSADTTARRLTIHRNTLRYRLDKVAALTGLNPRFFNEAVQLRVAMELEGEEVEPVRRHNFEAKHHDTFLSSIQ